MNIYLEEQIRMHPSMQMEDVVKLCYQAAYGAEHLLRDVEMARKYFFVEWEKTEAVDIPLFENISPVYCRANIGAWKFHGESGERLFDLFVQTAEKKVYDEELLRELFEEAEKVIAKAENELPGLSFTARDFRAFCREYLALGTPAMHHSEEYREKEKPAYRLVRRDLL